MNVLAISRMGMILLMLPLAASSTLFAQSGGSSPNSPQNHPSALDARQIAALSVAATQRSWQVRDHYTYMERDEDRRLDSLGQVKSEDVNITRVTLINGARFAQLMERNGQPPSAEQARKRDQDIDKMKHESPEEQTARLSKDQEARSFLQDVLGAFDFQLIGEEMVEGNPTYVLQATPHPGYQAHGKYARLFAKVQVKLWVAKKDFGWVKVDGQVMQPISMGLFVARVQRGSHIVLDQMSVGDGVWVPKRIEMRANARILFLKSLDIDRILIYSDYFLMADGPYSVSR